MTQQGLRCGNGRLARKIDGALRRWKAAGLQECLIVEGSRQVGKTSAVMEFGRESYVSVIVMDLLERPDFARIFDGPLDAESFISLISLYVPGAHMVPGSTLLFVDELQEFPGIRAALGRLAADGRFDIVAAMRPYPGGSSQQPGESRVVLGPLDFEEFLWSRGYSAEAVEQLGGYFDRQQPVPPALDQAMMRLVREYLVVGGMPEAVCEYAGSGDFSAVHEVQLKLHELYMSDIGAAGSDVRQRKARACYLSLPRQLAKENTKFSYAVVERGGRARKFEDSALWLSEAGIVQRCCAVSMPRFPLAAYEDPSRFRLYTVDTGLLMAMYDFSMKAAVLDETLDGPVLGGLYENLVACMLARREFPLRYWTSSDVHYSIEFVAEAAGSVIPIEVKVAKPRATASLDHVLRSSAVPMGCRLVDSDAVRVSGRASVSRDGKRVTLPLYMAMFL